MRYRSQYISNLLNKEKFDIHLSNVSQIGSENFSDDELDSFMTSLDANINNIYEKLIINLDYLSNKIDKNFNENQESFASIENRITQLEKSNSSSFVDPSYRIHEKSKTLFKDNVKKVNMNIDSFLEEELNFVNSSNSKISLENNKSLNYNLNWEEEFQKRGLSLEDDGIYEYENGDEDMKYDYLNGELPKTKIVKIRASDGIQTYTKDDISSFIENESKKLALNEVSKLNSQSEVTQKAWLANNQRLVELTNIIEAQEKEIRKLSQNVINKSHINENDIADIINNKALKILRDEYEARISSLEKGIEPLGIRMSTTNEDIANELRLKEEENRRLKELLNRNSNIVQNKIEESPIVQNVSPFPPKTQQVKKLDNARKRKQSHFFEIIEHKSPKITKADLDK
ncbi:MAG: hypothetical protein ACRCUM_03080 [Mycoplasmoidaceae bacterium]